MERPPANLGGGRVLQFASLAGCQPTSGDEGRELAALAIVRPDDEPHCVYLFHCDSDWNVVWDGWHLDVASALEDARVTYRPAPEFQEIALDE